MNTSKFAPLLSVAVALAGCASEPTTHSVVREVMDAQVVNPAGVPPEGALSADAKVSENAITELRKEASSRETAGSGVTIQVGSGSKR